MKLQEQIINIIHDKLRNPIYETLQLLNLKVFSNRATSPDFVTFLTKTPEYRAFLKNGGTTFY